MGALWLEVTQGPLAKERLEVDGQLTLGRAEQGLSNMGADPGLSRSHARLQPSADGQHLIVDDLGSANGTFVNGKRIDGPVVLTPGDKVDLGASSLVVRGDEQATRLSGRGAQQTRLSSARPQAPAVAGGRAADAPVAPPPRAPAAPPLPSVGPPVQSAPRLGGDGAAARRAPARRLPVLLLVLLVLAIAGLVVALATRTSSTTSSDGPFDGTAYVAANRAIPNGNSVLALRYLNGSLTPLRIREYATRGAGGTNLKLLANDADGQVATNNNHTLLFVVNQGSDTIAVFHIASDGTLSPVKGSPFGSGGSAPVSIAVHGNTAVVVNKAADGVRELATVAPTIVTFKINEDGSLTQVGAPASSTPNASPDQALLDPSGTVLLVPELVKGDLLTLTRGPDGAFHQAGQSMITAQQASFTAPPAKPPPLPQVPGISITPPAVQAPPGAPPGFAVQGFAFHPTAPYVYGGLPLGGELMVYSYANDGKLTFVKGVGSPGGQGICWTVVTPDGRYLYTGLTFSGMVGEYDLADPANPRFIGNVHLRGSGSTFNIRIDPTGKQLYALTLRSPYLLLSGNELHVLNIGSDGRLTEAAAPAALPVTANPSPPSLVQPYGLILVPHT